MKVENAILIAEVLSEGQPQNGQGHRSSGNFSTISVPEGATTLYWEIYENENEYIIHFDVKRDKSAAIDPTVFKSLQMASMTKIVRERSLYIANPVNTNRGDFLVKVWCW